MTCWVVIPVKRPGDGKQRLSSALDEAGRTALVGAMVTQVFGAADAARNVAKTFLLGPSRHGLPEAIPLLFAPGQGLNPALQAALAQVAESGISRVVFIAGDLPQVTAQDIELLAAAARGAIAIAPDRHEIGTNALSLPLPEAAGFIFAFGTDSFARHHTEAGRLGLAIETIHRQGLALDIDQPADLADAAGLMQQPR